MTETPTDAPIEPDTAEPLEEPAETEWPEPAQEPAEEPAETLDDDGTPGTGTEQPELNPEAEEAG